MPKQFTQWIKAKVSRLIDPERDERVSKLTRLIRQQLQLKQKAFRLDSFQQEFECHPAELQDAIYSVYRALIEKAWADGVVTEKETEQLKWIQRCLEFSDAEAYTLKLEFAEDHFRVALAQSLEDGELSADEESRLQQIAATVGKSAPDFSRKFFQKEGEAFLRSIFNASIEDGCLTRNEWNSLLSTSNRLGITTEELLNAVRRPASEFVEHMLTDAKAEGRITQEQEKELVWLMTTLDIDKRFVDYARQELNLLKLQMEIAAGRLPSLPCPDEIQIKSGEIVHAVADATLIVIRQLKSGPQRDKHFGRFIVLDSRMVFQSETLAQSFNYRKLLSHRGGPDWIEFQVENKPMWGLRFASDSPLIYQILSKAIGLTNQTAVRLQADEERTRHIPRDVRQRVWTLYGGRCADCHASDYLEYDHIIPVAKGGSNGETNVQLLCRKCNIKKSDHI